MAGMARGWRAYIWLFAGSVIESTLLPWPIEFPLLAVMLRGRGAVLPATIAVTLGSVVGGAVMFALGLGASSLIAPYVERWADVGEGLSYWQAHLYDKGPWAVFMAMMTPVPVQVTCLAAGLAGLNAGAVMVAIACGRAVRYGTMALLVYCFGTPLIRWWRSWPGLYRRLIIASFFAIFFILFVMIFIS